MGNPCGKYVYHKNKNVLDNRKANLVVSEQKNYKRKKSSSIYRGVSFKNNKWNARMMVNGKMNNVGYFKTPELAAIAYNKKAIELFGDKAILNVIPPDCS